MTTGSQSLLLGETLAMSIGNAGLDEIFKRLLKNVKKWRLLHIKTFKFEK